MAAGKITEVVGFWLYLKAKLARFVDKLNVWCEEEEL